MHNGLTLNFSEVRQIQGLLCICSIADCFDKNQKLIPIMDETNLKFG